MKVRSASVNARKRHVELVARAGVVYPFPFSRMEPRPSGKDPITRIFVDRELACEGVSFVLASGAEGCVLLDQALDYNSDPAYVTRMLIHQLTCEARDGMKEAGFSIRELARRLGTSVPQVYRLLDTTNSTKSVAQLLSLLQVLGCEVRVVVRQPRRRSRTHTTAPRPRKAA